MDTLRRSHQVMSAILHGVADIHKLKMCKFTPDALFSACTFTVFGQRDATYKKIKCQERTVHWKVL